MPAIGEAWIPVKPDLSGFGKDVDRQTSGAMGSIKSFAKTAAAAFAGAFAVSKGIDFLKGTISAASDLNETVSKTRTIFGPASAGLEKWASTAAKSFGQSRQQALDAASTFGNLFVQLGVGSDEAAKMSTQMVELASDFASFHNADPTQVIEAQTAAFRGEYDALQRFVPTINAATVEQEALRMTGKATTKELTAQEKALAVQALMMKGAGDATGDFARTSDSLANKQRIASAQWSDMTARIGQQLLPVMTALTGFVSTSVIPAIGRIGEWIGSLSPYFEAFQAVVSSVIGTVVGWFQTGESGIGGSASRIGGIIEALRDLFGSVFDAIKSALSVWVDVVTGMWDRFGAHILDYARTTFDNILRVVDSVLEVIRGVFETFVGVFTGDWSRAWNGVKQILAGVWDAMRAIVSQAIAAVKYILGLGLEAIQLAWGLAWSGIKTALDGIWQAIKDATSAALNALVQWFAELPGRLVGAVQAAAGALQSLGKWVVEKIVEGVVFLANAAGGLFDWFRGLPDKLWGVVTAAAESMRSIGKKLIEFIIEGIGSMAGAIGNAVTGIIPDSIAGLDMPWKGGDGPGAVPAGGGRGSAGGMARNAVARFGGRITSSYRDPARNARAGGSPTSYHLDARNPAHDIVGPNMRGMFDWLYRTYGSSIREMIYGNRMVKNGRLMPYRPNDHWDHVHVAHQGGYVSPQGIIPLRADELLTKLQVGETVLPRDFDGAGESLPDPDDWGRVAARSFSREMRKMARTA